MNLCNLLVFAIFLLFYVPHSIAQQPTVNPIFTQARQRCYEAQKLKPADIASIENGQYYKLDPKTTPENVLCYMTCFYKAFGMLGANDTLNKEIIAKMVAELYKGNKDGGVIALRKCQDLKGATTCEKVFNFEACLRKDL